MLDKDAYVEGRQDKILESFERNEQGLTFIFLYHCLSKHKSVRY